MYNQPIPVIWTKRKYVPGRRKIPVMVRSRSHSVPLLNVYGPRPIRPENIGFEYRPASILIMGHSFIRNLEEFMLKNYGYNHNMGLSYNTANVQFHGVGGRTVQKFIHNDLYVVQRLRPDILYLELGTNDLSHPDSTFDQVAADIEKLVWQCKTAGAKFVIVGQTLFRYEPLNEWFLERYPLDPDFNLKVIWYNNCLKEKLDPSSIPNCLYWRHVGLWHPSVPTIKGEDGVHLTDWGNQCLYRSIRGALVHGIRRSEVYLRI